MSIAAEIQCAAETIAPHVRRTPLEFSHALSALGQSHVFIKLENFQLTGSFKARGALHRLCTLSTEQRESGVVTASSGNHGAGVAYGAQQLGISALVYVPEHTPESKTKGIKRYGAEVRRFGSDCVLTEAEARAEATRSGRVYVSPYNDKDVVLGQGTIAVEIIEQLAESNSAPLDAIFVALGGGGLISGIGSYFKDASPNTKIVACSPAASPAMHECLREGKIIDVPCDDTLSSSTAGGVEDGSITFEYCQKVVDNSILVSEEEIAQAMKMFLDSHHMLVEGAAGVAIAGYLKQQKDHAGQNVGIVICGANIGSETLKKVLF